MYIYIYIHTYTLAHTHTYSHTQHTRTHAHTHTRTHPQTRAIKTETLQRTASSKNRHYTNDRSRTTEEAEHFDMKQYTFRHEALHESLRKLNEEAERALMSTSKYTGLFRENVGLF